MHYWYDIYKPVIVTKERPESFYRQFSLEEFEEIFAKDMAKVTIEAYHAAKAITSMEFIWIKIDKPVFFIPEDVLTFCRNTKNQVTPRDLKTPLAFCIAWHPATKNPSCLVNVNNDNFTIHINDYRRQGTYTLFVPCDTDFTKPEEMDSNFTQLTLDIFGVLTYMQAFPNLVTPGYPSDIKPRCERYNEVKASRIMLHPKLCRNIPMSHIRRGHWRSLRDPRFKRNPDESIRIVYVNPAIVGKITPYTVGNKEPLPEEIEHETTV